MARRGAAAVIPKSDCFRRPGLGLGAPIESATIESNPIESNRIGARQGKAKTRTKQAAPWFLGPRVFFFLFHPTAKANKQFTGALGERAAAIHRAASCACVLWRPLAVPPALCLPPILTPAPLQSSPSPRAPSFVLSVRPVFACLSVCACFWRARVWFSVGLFTSVGPSAGSPCPPTHARHPHKSHCARPRRPTKTIHSTPRQTGKYEEMNGRTRPCLLTTRVFDPRCAIPVRFPHTCIAFK